MSRSTRKSRTGLPTRPRFESLPDRTLLSTFTVTNPGDNGDNFHPEVGSLRWAILQADLTPVASVNGSPVPHQILFNLGPGLQTILPTAALPTIGVPVVIDATGGVLGQLPRVAINGAFAGASADGLTIAGGNSTIEGLEIIGFGGSGLVLTTGARNTVVDDVLGTDYAYQESAYHSQNGKPVQAATPDGNKVNGLSILSSDDNMIGGGTAATRNFIGGNGGDGIYLHTSSGNVIQGDTIGLDRSGFGNAGNYEDGVRIDNGTDNIVGAQTTLDQRNVISANYGAGVTIIGNYATRNHILGNDIGTAINGTATLEGTQEPVVSSDSQTYPDAQNQYTGNGADGVHISSGTDNTIGGLGPTLIDPTSGRPFNVQSDVIDNNTGNGVSIDDQVTYPGDPSAPTYLHLGNVVQADMIGVDRSGIRGFGNALNGVLISETVGNTIGATTDFWQRNVISANGINGVAVSGIDATNNQISGNIIGLDADGQSTPVDTSGVYDHRLMFGNYNSGVLISRAVGCTVGGVGPIKLDPVTGRMANVRANLIAHNDIDGITIEDDNLLDSTQSATSGSSQSTNSASNPQFNYVFGNMIGMNADGTADYNGGNGVTVQSTSFVSIGSRRPGGSNVISGNNYDGIEISESNKIYIQNNFIGVDPTGTKAVPNDIGIEVHGEKGGNITIAQNVISGNTTAAVDIHDGWIGSNITYGNSDIQSISYQHVDQSSSNGYYCILANNDIGTDLTGEHAISITADAPNNGPPLKQSDLYAKDGTFSYPADFVADPTRPIVGILINNAAGISIGEYEGDGNVISGNNVGVLMGGINSSHNFVIGNVIGLDLTMSTAIHNAIGLDINGTVAAFNPSTQHDVAPASQNTGWVEGNVISGNTWAGIDLSGPGAAWYAVFDNHIGTDGTGKSARPNWVGVFIQDAPDNLIGGPLSWQRNEISGNTLAGLYMAGAGATDNVVWNNAIGTTLKGKRGPGNQGYGILLYGTSVNVIGTYTGQHDTLTDQNGNYPNMLTSEFANNDGTPILEENAIGGSGIANIRTIPGPVGLADRTIADLPPSLAQVTGAKIAATAHPTSGGKAAPSTAGSSRPRTSAHTKAMSTSKTSPKSGSGASA